MLEYFSRVIFLIIVLEVSTHTQIRIINVIRCMKRSSSMIFFSLIFLFLVGLFTANPIIFGLTTSGPVPIPGSLISIPVKSDSLISSSITSTPETVSVQSTSSSPYSISLVKSGLAASDPLDNETKTQQQLQSNPRYWTYGGDAPLQTPPAPYDFYKDPQGLHIGVQSTGNDTSGNPKWAGFYALAPGTNAALFHALISTPLRSIPTSNNYYENSLYVQTSINVPNAQVNYVACGSNTATYGTLWAVYSATGDIHGATSFAQLYLDSSPNQPLTRECTIITNGSNYLKVYIDGTMVYNSTTLKLQMQEPFNAFLEPQTSYAGQLLNGIYKDYYATTVETIQVTNNPILAATVDLVDSSNHIIASAPVTSGTAILNIGQFHMPLSANIKVYDSNNNELASTSSPVGIFGGDVYKVKSLLGL